MPPLHPLIPRTPTGPVATFPSAPGHVRRRVSQQNRATLPHRVLLLVSVLCPRRRRAPRDDHVPAQQAPRPPPERSGSGLADGFGALGLPYVWGGGETAASTAAAAAAGTS